MMEQRKMALMAGDEVELRERHDDFHIKIPDGIPGIVRSVREVAMVEFPDVGEVAVDGDNLLRRTEEIDGRTIGEMAMPTEKARRALMRALQFDVPWDFDTKPEFNDPKWADWAEKWRKLEERANTAHFLLLTRENVAMVEFEAGVTFTPAGVERIA